VFASQIKTQDDDRQNQGEHICHIACPVQEFDFLVLKSELYGGFGMHHVYQYKVEGSDAHQQNVAGHKIIHKTLQVSQTKVHGQ
jgi:hypothetical protein